ncbi:hypothetical protein NBRC103581_02074 [Gluconobacter wancherniae NBRC 103581]|nr:hypothetical protein NBRC103581_02074 [Gluconobacter wancherniae NBRC 103581]
MRDVSLLECPVSDLFILSSVPRFCTASNGERLCAYENQRNHHQWRSSSGLLGGSGVSEGLFLSLPGAMSCRWSTNSGCRAASRKASSSSVRPFRTPFRRKSVETRSRFDRAAIRNTLGARSPRSILLSVEASTPSSRAHSLWLGITSSRAQAMRVPMARWRVFRVSGRLCLAMRPF